MWQTITAFFTAVGQVFGFVNKRTELKNAPDVRQAAIGQNEADRKNAIEGHVAKKDLAATRADLAE